MLREAQTGPGQRANMGCKAENEGEESEKSSNPHIIKSKDSKESDKMIFDALSYDATDVSDAEAIAEIPKQKGWTPEMDWCFFEKAEPRLGTRVG